MKITDPNLPANLSEAARVWIYQAEAQLTDEEVDRIKAACDQFIPEWQAHGKNLKADYRILFNRFLCLFVDETAQGATGCSIDRSVRFIQDLEKSLGKNLMQRTRILYVNESGELAETDMNGIKGKLQEDSLVFNNLVPTLGEMKKNWITTANRSWHARFL